MLGLVGSVYTWFVCIYLLDRSQKVHSVGIEPTQKDVNESRRNVYQPLDDTPVLKILLTQ